jgi:hypothetical protein
MKALVEVLTDAAPRSAVPSGVVESTQQDHRRGQ